MFKVQVTGIAPTTSKDTLHEFFSFCGKIESIDLDLEEDKQKSAVITFEKSSAANTALMLDGGALDGATLHVSSDTPHTDPAESQEHHGTPPHIEQSDKPRAGIAAEYLAKGYQLSDHILQRAIEIDNKQGISNKFISYIHGLDTSIGQRALGPDQTISGKVQSTFYQARERAKSMDEQKGITKVAHEYYSRALASPMGKKVLSFYTNTSKQVFDIHDEARRIVEHKKTSATPKPATPPPTARSDAAASGGLGAQPETTTHAAPPAV